MGIGKITGDSATIDAGAGARSPSDRAGIAAAGSPVDMAKGVSGDDFAKRVPTDVRLENLKAVAEVWSRHRELTKGNENIAADKLDLDELSKGRIDKDGKNIGWTDANGEAHPALGEMGSMPAEQQMKELEAAGREFRRRQEERLRGEVPRMRNYVRGATASDFQEWEATHRTRIMTSGMAELVGAVERNAAITGGARNVTTFDSLSSDEQCAANLARASGGDLDPAEALRAKTEAAADRYVRWQIEARQKAVAEMVVQSGGLMSEQTAARRVGEIYDGLADGLIGKFAEAGEFDRARTFVGRAESLGYSGAVKARAMRRIELAEEAARKRDYAWIENMATSAIAAGRLKDAIDPQTGDELPGMEDVIEGIRGSKGAYESGTETRAAFDKLEAKVDEQADRQAASEIWLELPDLFLSHDGTMRNDVKNPYDKGTRKHRLFPALARDFRRLMGEVVDAETKERREERSGQLKAEMVLAARTAPGAFMARLAEEARSGGISVAQYNDIADDARKLYANGAAAEKAAAMLDIFQRTFFADPDLGVNLSDIYKYDKGEGRVVAKPPKDFDLTKLDVEYKTEDGDRAFTSQQQLWLMNLMLKLSFHEGELVLWDVESGAKSAEPKKVSPMQYFSDVCRKIKFSNEVQSPDVQRTIDSLAEVALGIETDIAARNEYAVRTAPRPEKTRKPPKMPRLDRARSKEDDE